MSSGRSELDLRPTRRGGAHQHARQVAPLMSPVVSALGRERAAQTRIDGSERQDEAY